MYSMYCNTLICVLYSKAFSNKVTETFWVKLQTDGERNWFMERVFLWRLEARVWSGQRDGWGCLFGVELAGGGEGCPDKVCYWRSYKNWRLRARPRLFPTRSTFFSAGMRHGHLLQAQTYNLGLSGPLSSRIQWSAGPFSATPPQAAGYLHTHSFDTSLSQEAYRLSRIRGGLRFSCCSALSRLKAKIAAWPSVRRILLIPPEYQNVNSQI